MIESNTSQGRFSSHCIARYLVWCAEHRWVISDNHEEELDWISVRWNVLESVDERIYCSRIWETSTQQMKNDDEKRSCLSSSLRILPENTTKVSHNASNQVNTKCSEEESKEVFEMIVSSETEIQNEWHKEGREYLQHNMWKHSSKQIRSGCIHLVHKFSFKDRHLQRHLNNDKSNSRKHEWVDQQERKSFDILNLILDSSDSCREVNNRVSNSEKQKQNENCNYHNIQEESLKCSRVSEEIGQVPSKNQLELIACRHLSFPLDFCKLGFYTIIKFDNGLHLLNDTGFQNIIEVLSQFIHSEAWSHHIRGLHSFNDEVCWIHESTNFDAHWA